ncbi:MAG: hypothetical protein R2695_10715 [Acidimicrobiales bacterium]
MLNTFFTGPPHFFFAPSCFWGHFVRASSLKDCQISNTSPVRSQR